LLSRITVANLEDVGYEVDYTNVDVYTADNINATCRCTQQRTLGTTHETIPQTSFVFEQHHPRQLSDKVYNKVISYGKMKLAEKKERYDAAVATYGGNINDGQKFVGDQAITVTVMENGEIYSIVVRA
jgi:hypothetical protein